MREKKRRLSGNWGGQGILLICFVALLLLICSVLMQVYAGVAKISRQAKDLNNAVQLCRTAQEAFYGTESLDEAMQALGGEAGERTISFDEKLHCVEQGYYLMIWTETTEESMQFCEVSVYSEAELLYSLTLERYCSEVMSE